MKLLPHPIVGNCEASINGHPLTLSADQHEALVEELCSLAFCFPHLCPRIGYLAKELDLPEVSLYVSWCQEAISSKLTTVQTSGPTKLRKRKQKPRSI